MRSCGYRSGMRMSNFGWIEETLFLMIVIRVMRVFMLFQWTNIIRKIASR